MILQELHGASSNQLAASLHSETPSGELWKLLAPPWHCFSAALLNSYHRIALVTFIECIVHFFHFKLMSQEPMSLFSVACLTSHS